MDPHVRRAALRAAAKTAIALSLGGGQLAGCADSHEHSRVMTPTDASMTHDAWMTVDAAVPVDAPLLDAGLADCDEHLASLPRTSDDVWTARFEGADAHTGECCMELHMIAERGEPTGAGPAVDMACCYVVTDAPYYVGFSPLGCTPWGPPCPPEMEPAIA